MKPRSQFREFLKGLLEEGGSHQAGIVWGLRVSLTGLEALTGRETMSRLTATLRRDESISEMAKRGFNAEKRC